MKNSLFKAKHVFFIVGTHIKLELLSSKKNKAYKKANDYTQNGSYKLLGILDYKEFCESSEL